MTPFMLKSSLIETSDPSDSPAEPSKDLENPNTLENLDAPALLQVINCETVEMVYVTYHVDVGETPFFIGIDYDKKKIVISIRGTLSMKVRNGLLRSFFSIST